jgi:nucleoside-diphosphate-sugar epimerase
MNSLFHVLNLAKAGKIKKDILAIEYCSFGPTTPKENTHTIMEPSTVCVSKQAGERWCEYYHNIFGVDRQHPLSRFDQLVITSWWRNCQIML